MELSRVERWMLANQYRILEALYPEDAADFAKKRLVLEEGYELEYDWLIDDIHRDKDCMTADECRDVLDILEMFRAMKWAYEAQSDKTWAEARKTLFLGFDGNNEGKQLGYAIHLRDQEKYEEQFRDLLGDEKRDLNSHFPTLARYRAMLDVWRAAADKQHLTSDDLKEIRAAAEGSQPRRDSR
jgi:uncharacterized protein YfbU (UPF0304 family)